MLFIFKSQNCLYATGKYTRNYRQVAGKQHFARHWFVFLLRKLAAKWYAERKHVYGYAVVIGWLRRQLHNVPIKADPDQKAHF